MPTELRLRLPSNAQPYVRPNASLTVARWSAFKLNECGVIMLFVMALVEWRKVIQSGVW